VKQSAHQPDRRGLAAAVGPEEAEDLAALHLQREVVHDVLVAEALVEAADVDRVGFAVAFTAASRRRAGRAAVAARLPSTARASTMNTSFAAVSLL
jgi:hypothetical protein